ncbi:hypothetical protein [Couchioplanes caeruleus]|uniref:Excreted virulence factor EspC (Type VII ESX diderm) n=1 Tax=Couchioplanes caeruleus subsp. caeruleus TaxID=56427 RepID=A0A1K0FMD3_9ACTN|nr:hypothetical protein [Couchioplanes caeruleus]OJF13999.1 hypothetical protein BG844_12140 [Couchioplanes caeruleus subsp. caeruleus]
MAGELNLDPQRAIAASRDLSASGTHLVNLNNGVVADIAQASGDQPWGKDEIGAAFHKNYAPLLTQFTAAFAKVAQYVEGLGDAAEQSVHDNTGADDRAQATVTKAYRS